MNVRPKNVFRMTAILFAAATMAGGVGVAVSPTSAVQAQDDPSKPAYFTEKVQPVLEANCYRCHGGLNHRGGYNMNTRDSMFKGGHHGNAIVAGHPESSMMVRLARHEGPADDPMPMPPPPKAKISDESIAILEKWVKAGAITPADPLYTAPPVAAAPAAAP